MQIIKGDLWDEPADAIVISTNGFVKRSGANVMGKGCARQAADKFKDLPMILGASLKSFGNVPTILMDDMGDGRALVTFPVKPRVVFFDGHNVVSHLNGKFTIGRSVPGWGAKATIELIKLSAEKLVMLTDSMEWKKVVIPQPGCGAGELDWKDVMPILAEILDDRFYSISPKEGKK